MKLVAKGRRGEIWLDETTQIALKKAKNPTKKAAINKEIQILKKLNNIKINFVPQLIQYGDGWFKYKRIHGIHLQDFIKNLNLNQKKYIFKNLLDKLYILDQHGIIHGEMLRPYKNVLVKIKLQTIIKKITDNLNYNHRQFLFQSQTIYNNQKENIINNIGNKSSDIINNNHPKSSKYIIGYHHLSSDILFNLQISYFPSSDIIIIDFERGKLNDFSGKNMRSFAQFLKNENILTINDLKQLKDLKLEQIYNFLKDKLI